MQKNKAGQAFLQAESVCSCWLKAFLEVVKMSMSHALRSKADVFRRMKNSVISQAFVVDVK